MLCANPQCTNPPVQMFAALAFILISSMLDWDSAHKLLNLKKKNLLRVFKIEQPRETALSPEGSSQRGFSPLYISNRAGPISLLHTGESELVTPTKADILFSDVFFVSNLNSFLSHALWEDHLPHMHASSFIYSFPFLKNGLKHCLNCICCTYSSGTNQEFNMTPL